MENQIQKPETFRLWWKRKDSERRIPAGVAFYDEKHGDYQLKIDYVQAVADQQPQAFFLRAVGTEGEKMNYRAEVALKKNGKVVGRRPIGEGYSSQDTNGEVLIDFGPFEKFLVMTLNQ